MYQILSRNLNKLKYFTLFIFFITFFLLLAVAYKNDEIAGKKEKSISYQDSSINAVKKFLLSKIKDKVSICCEPKFSILK